MPSLDHLNFSLKLQALDYFLLKFSKLLMLLLLSNKIMFFSCFRYIIYLFKFCVGFVADGDSFECAYT